MILQFQDPTFQQQKVRDPAIVAVVVADYSDLGIGKRVCGMIWDDNTFVDDSYQHEYTASELRQIADELDRLNSLPTGDRDE